MKKIKVSLIICIVAFTVLSISAKRVEACGYAQIVSARIINSGGWRDGWALFDYQVKYRWDKRSRTAYWYQTTGRANASFLEMRVSGGLGYTSSDYNYYYRTVTAGFRARVVNPLSYGYAPYGYQNQLGNFANEFKIRYCY